MARFFELWQADQKKRKASDYTSGSGLRKVPETFHNVDDYLDVFESLLLEECRSQILRGDEEEGLADVHLGLHIFFCSS